MIGYRPCGACVAYVPEVAGCGHWKPGQEAEGGRKGKNRDRDANRARSRAYRERQKLEVQAARERGRQIARGEA